MTEEAIQKNIASFPKRGKMVQSGGKNWRYRVGKGGHVVLYCEDGKRRLCVGAWTIKGIAPDDFDDGKWDRSTDGMLRPGDVVAWLDRQ